MKTVVLHATAEEAMPLFESISDKVELIFLPDGQGLEDHLDSVEIIYGGISERDFQLAKKLRWVQLLSTGAESMTFPAFIDSKVTLTSLGNALSSIVSEQAIALFLSLTRNLHLLRDQQLNSKWEVLVGHDVKGMKVGILGFGRIGHCIAERLKAFEPELHALDLKPQSPPSYMKSVNTLDGLADFCSNCQAIISTLPLTHSTHEILNRDMIFSMPKGGILINVGRGGTVNEEALLEALRTNHLSGAGLDVFATEPLPSTSPLWNEPKLLLTPHSAAYSHNLQLKKVGWFAKNLERFIKGEPLQGLVSRDELTVA